jgi:uncharacterized protein (UPF0332 family)
MGISIGDLIKFAEANAKADASEVELRACISRAYYAAYHAAVPFAGKLPASAAIARGADPASVKLSHAEVVHRLREWKTEGLHPKLPGMKSASGALWRAVESAISARVIADYRLGNQVTLAEAQSQIERVKQISRKLQQIQNLIAETGEQAVKGAGS